MEVNNVDNSGNSVPIPVVEGKGALSFALEKIKELGSALAIVTFGLFYAIGKPVVLYFKKCFEVEPIRQASLPSPTASPSFTIIRSRSFDEEESRPSTPATPASPVPFEELPEPTTEDSLLRGYIAIINALIVTKRSKDLVKARNWLNQEVAKILRANGKTDFAVAIQHPSFKSFVKETLKTVLIKLKDNAEEREKYLQSFGTLLNKDEIDLIVRKL